MAGFATYVGRGVGTFTSSKDSKHIQQVRDTPIFCTTKRPPLYVKNGVIDDRKTDMMVVPWKMFEFKYQIPEGSQHRIEPCPSCFAKLVFTDLAFN